jgi:hypothetical protein
VGYSVVNVDELEGEGPGGMVRFVQRNLDVQARRDSYEPRGPF